MANAANQVRINSAVNAFVNLVNGPVVNLPAIAAAIAADPELASALVPTLRVLINYIDEARA